MVTVTVTVTVTVIVKVIRIISAMIGRYSNGWGTELAFKLATMSVHVRLVTMSVHV